MDFVFVRSRNKEKEGYGSVYARVRTGGKNKKYVLGLTIKESEWLKYKSMKYVSSALMPSIGIRFSQFIQILTQIKIAFEECFNPSTATTVIHNIIYASMYQADGAVQPQMPRKSDILLSDFMQRYIGELQSGIRTKRRSSLPVSAGYCRNMHCALVCLRDYEEKTGRRHTLDEINMTFQRNFVHYLRERGLMQNTINVRMGSICNTMRVAYFEKKTLCVDFQHPDFVPAKEEVEEIHLSPEQLDQMMTADFTALAPTLTQKMQNSIRVVRDIFVIGCLTGQRFSDYCRINANMLTRINGCDFISIRQVKTGKKVLIPMDLRVRRILEAYGGSLPEIGRQSFNQHLRHIGELLGWTHRVYFEKRTEQEASRFCDLLGSHTARRTFATNAYAAGVPLASIMTVTGHSSEKNLRTYLRLDSHERAIIAAADFKGFIQL